MSEREAWIWMISKAAWAGTSHRVGCDMVDVPRGSFMETLRNMQSMFMWGSDKKVRNFLKKLENHEMIAVLSVGKRNARKTHVTIHNYEEYQSGGRSKDAAKTHGGRSGDAVKKQGNKVTKKDTYVSSSKEAEDYLRYLEALPNAVESKAGEQAFSDLLESGESADIIISAAVAYAQTVKSWSGEGKVQQSGNFLNADRGKWREFVPKPKPVPPTKAERMEFWANSINLGRFVSQSSVTPDFARDMIAAGLVTPEKLKERGIAA